MKTTIKKLVLITIIFITYCCTIAFGADSEYRFTHNDHDVLLIGTIESIEDNKMVIKAVDYIVSSKDLNINDVKKQLEPETVTIIVNDFYDLDNFNVSDSVIASLNKNGELFDVAHGLFKTDSLSYDTLKVEAFSPALSALFTDFVNSGGIYNDFNFNQDGSVARVYNGVETIIYKKEISVNNANLTKQDPKLSLSTQTEQEPLTNISNKNTVQKNITIVFVIILSLIYIVLIIFKKSQITKKRGE